MKTIPPISAVMTPFPYSIEVEAGVLKARDVMLKNDIRHLPVVEKGKLTGVLALRDVEQYLHSCSERDTGRHQVRDLMAFDTYIVDVSHPLDRVLSEMARRRVDSALVVKQERLAGIFTVTDACKLFVKDLRSRFGSGPGGDVA